jgi:hypothetical protein
MKNKSLTMSEIRTILDKLPPYSKVINVIGSGEPFCYPYWQEFVDEIKKRNIRLMLTSNAIMMNDEIIKNLPNGTEIYFSLDDTTQNINSPRKENVDIAMENIRKLRSLRTDVKIVLQRVFVKGTIGTVKDYIKFALSINGDVSFIFPLCYTKEMYEKLYPTDSEKKTLMMIINDSVSTSNLYYVDRFTPFPKKGICPDPFRTLFIGVNGDIWVCCHMYSARPNIDSEKPYFTEYWKNTEYKVPSYQYKIGNIFKDDPVALFNTNQMMIIRGRIIVSDDNDFPIREKMDFEKTKYSYCDVCLWRWGCVG